MLRFAKVAVSIILMIFVATLAGSAQRPAVIEQNLELRLKPGKLLNGVPADFTFELVNVSDHDVRVPKPKVDCNSSLDGSIWLQLDFTPAKFNDKGSAFVCVDDYGSLPVITQRSKNWLLLHPGEMISQTLDQRGLHYDDKGAGRYTFWAEYHSPTIGPQDQSTLREAGIDFPHHDLKTTRFVYKAR